MWSHGLDRKTSPSALQPLNICLSLPSVSVCDKQSVHEAAEACGFISGQEYLPSKLQPHSVYPS